MRKITFLFSLIMTLFLVGCSSSSGLSGFTKDFNENARKYNVLELVEKEFGEIEDDENMSWQTLFDSQKYDIDAKYKDGKNITGYRITIKEIEKFIENDGEAYDATLNIVDILGLDLKKIDEEFQKVSTKDNEGYIDNGYKVGLFYTGLSDTKITDAEMYINIDKE